MNTCPCGIARVDCEYHRPEPEPTHDDECFDRLSHLTRAQKTELELWLDAVELGESAAVIGVSDMHRIGQGVVRLSYDCGEYVRTYQDGKLVDEEPAEAYQLPSGTQLLVVTPRGIEPYRGWDIIDGSWVFWP